MPNDENMGMFEAKIVVSKRLLYDTLVTAMKRIAAIEKVALYARVSTKDGRQDTENQLIALRDYCAKQGWEIAARIEFRETGDIAILTTFDRLPGDEHQIRGAVIRAKIDVFGNPAAEFREDHDDDVIGQTPPPGIGQEADP